MPNPAAGVFKQLAYKKELVAYGTAAVQAGAQSLRRVESSIDLTKDTYQSNEIRTDLQMADFRHGVRRVTGKLSGELSPKTYSDFFAWGLKRDFTAVTALTGATVTVASPTNGVYPITATGVTLLAGGFKVGMVFRFTAGTLVVGNQNVNLLITDITSETAFSVIVLNGKALTVESAKTGCTLTPTGKVTWTPTTGHTDASFSLEHWYSDLAQSELFLGCKVAALNLSLPPSGLATIDIDIAGQDYADVISKRGSVALGSQYFTSPTAATTTGLLAAVNGKVLVGGVVVANITGLQLAVSVATTGDPVVGSNTVPFQFAGRVLASGQMSVYFDSVTQRDAFVNETEQGIVIVLTSDNADGSDFLSFVLPRCKFGGSQKNDGEIGIVQTIPFQALLNSVGGTGIKSEKTTLLVQDSAA